MALSLSNFPNLTHWWNFRSSIVIPLSALLAPALDCFWNKFFLAIIFFFYFLGSFCISNLSFIPNLHSGISERWHFTTIWPFTSALKMVPKKLVLSSSFSFKWTFVWHQEIHIFYDINVNFILLVLNSFCSPTCHTCCLSCQLYQFIKTLLLNFKPTFLNIFLQKIWVQNLRDSIIHDL